MILNPPKPFFWQFGHNIDFCAPTGAYLPQKSLNFWPKTYLKHAEMGFGVHLWLKVPPN